MYSSLLLYHSTVVNVESREVGGEGKEDGKEGIGDRHTDRRALLIS